MHMSIQCLFVCLSKKICVGRIGITPSLKKLPNLLHTAKFFAKEQVSTKAQEINTTKKKPFLSSTDSHEISCHSIASQNPILWLVNLLNSICPCVARWHQFVLLHKTKDFWNSMFETLKKLESHLAIALCDSYASLGLATSHTYL